MNCLNSSQFVDLSLSEWLIEQCTAMGIAHPTPVQHHCIPKILKGENCIGVSQTGSGKTLAFALPILQVLAEDPYGIFALILTPTRELAVQISDQFKVIGKPIHIEVSVVIGGMNMVSQSCEISSQPHIMVATPGRLADLLNSGNDISFKRTKFLVLDEADRLLEGQFTEQLEVIFNALPAKRQTLLFSATMSKNLEELQKISCIEPFIWTTESEVSTVEKLDQHYVLVPRMIVKNACLIEVINNFQRKYPNNSIIVFTKNCRWCQIVSIALKNLGFQNVALNSNLRQWERVSSITKFKSNKVKLLVATDIASRGLDIPMVDLVINYSVPLIPKNYIHRVGRTARAGKGGQAITFVTPKEVLALKNIEKEINVQITEQKISTKPLSAPSSDKNIQKLSCTSLYNIVGTVVYLPPSSLLIGFQDIDPPPIDTTMLHKINRIRFDKKILKILLEVEVAWREASISLEDQDADKRKEINKRKQQILDGEVENSIGKISKKSKLKNNLNLKNKRHKKNANNSGAIIV